MIQLWPFKTAFTKRGIPITILSDNVQEEFMGSVHKLLHAYGVGSNQSEYQKENHNPD